ncbi:MAG: methyltransferase domain-containing protein [Pirellulales bacterium]|nr:methyltransferase domain-containing protein [Pirellulales bacterium]
MRQRLAEYRLFWREFRQTFESTGAVLPSGRSLAQALASRVGTGEGPQRILEVGPGTGAVTNHVISRLRPDDHLDLVELNPRFADALRARLANESRWRQVVERVRVLEMPMEELGAEQPYDAIVSGLPLNNFSCESVRKILQQFHHLAAPQAQLSFFEYIAIRKAKALCSKLAERRRLSGIEQLLYREFASWQVARQCVLANVPPAWVHHLCLPGTTNGAV